MRKKLHVSLFVLIAAALIVGACSPAAPAEAPEAEPTAASASDAEVEVEVEAEEEAVDDPMAMYAPEAVSGDIVTAGSSTVFPLSERMKQRFEEEGYTGVITIDSIGSGGGYERFCVNGETDISNASRAIKDSEVESCQSIGREPIEFRVGTDALSVVVSKDNDFVDDVTLEELALIFGAAETWADVRAEWPAEPIQRFIPGTDSGTFDYFVEAIFDEDEGPILAASNTQLSEDDNVLVRGVQGSPYAVGFFGFAYYQENADTLNVLSLGGVAPTAETAESGEYPIARPLFIYSDATILQEKPQVAAFVYFYLTNVNNEIVDVGYFPASDAALQAAMDAWTAAVSGEAAAVEEADDSMAEYAPEAVSGDIVTAGSSTVFPLSERMKQRFEEEGYTGVITIDSIGSGGGYERFCVNGETDISNASRAIKDSEVESCQSIGREPIEFRVGTDALSVVVSKDNDFVDDVTLEELALIFGAAETWADVRAEWPAEPIQRFIPGTDSGTFDYFVEAIFDEDEGPILAASNTQLSEDDNVLVRGVQGSPYAVGFFGFAYYQENADTLNVLSLGGVAPTAETAESGEYPIARPLFIYSDATILQEKPQVAAFVYFYLTNVNNEIVDVGYFPASDAALQAAMDAWMDAVGK